MCLTVYPLNIGVTLYYYTAIYTATPVRITSR